MKKTLEDEFVDKNKSWLNKKAQLAKMSELGQESTPEFLKLKEEANTDYRAALKLLRSNSKSVKQSTFNIDDLIPFIRSIRKSDSLISKFLLPDLAVEEEFCMIGIWRTKSNGIISELLTELPSEFTWNQIIQNLVQKGFLKVDGMRFTAIIDEVRYKHDLLQKLAATYFNGSFKELGKFLVQKREFGHEELDEMVRALGTVINH